MTSDPYAYPYFFLRHYDLLAKLLATPLRNDEIASLYDSSYYEGVDIDVARGIEVLREQGVEVKRPPITFATRAAYLATGMGGLSWPYSEARIENLRQQLTAELYGAITERVEALGPAFEEIKGNGTPYTQLLYWIAESDYNLRRQCKWSPPDPPPTSEEEALHFMIRRRAQEARQLMAFTLSPETEKMIRKIIRELAPSPSPARTHVKIMMEHSDRQAICTALGAEYNPTNRFSWMPDELQKTCKLFLADRRILALARGVNIDADKEIARVEELHRSGEVHAKLLEQLNMLMQENTMLRVAAFGSAAAKTAGAPPTYGNPALFRRCEELDLSVRSANCLQNNGIEYIWQLVEKTEGEMLKLKNFGRKSLNEIKDVLGGLGLSLGMKGVAPPAKG